MTQGLRSGILAEPLIGTFVKVPRAEIVEILALAGFDFVVCDLIHSEITDAEAISVVLAGRACGIAVVPRVHPSSVALLTKLLAAGADGLHLGADYPPGSGVNDVVKTLRYPPVGTREVSFSQREANYGLRSHAELIEQGNSALLVAQWFGTTQADYAEVSASGADVVFVPPQGRSGAPSGTEVVETWEHLERIAQFYRQSNTSLGTYTATPRDASRAIELGYRYVLLGTDVTMFHASARQLVDDLAGERTLTGAAAAPAI